MNKQAFLWNQFRLVLLMLMIFAPVAGRADEIARKHHPWARFSPGAWVETRVSTEVFDKEGKVVDKGVTEMKMTLKKVGDTEITIETTKSELVDGKWLDHPPKVGKQGLYGESEGQKVTIKNLEPETLTVEGREVSCRVRRIEVSEPGGKHLQVAKVWYNNEVAPYVFKKVTSIKEHDKKAVLSEVDMLVDALRMPCLVGDRLCSAAHLRSTTTHARGTAVTLAYASSKVPGRLIRQCTKELDKEGRLVRRSVLEVTDFGLKPSEEETRRRRASRRARELRRSSRKKSGE